MGINAIEFKLRLIDILTRYGRLIAERLICLNYINHQLIDTNQYKWTLYNFIKSKMICSNDAIDQQSLSSLCCIELIQYLDHIYKRLMKLISQTILNNDSIGLNIQLGNNALPSWLLLSTHYIVNENLSSMNYGSIGGRLITFFILYMIIKQQYAEAIYYFLRLLYQVRLIIIILLIFPCINVS
ncbi:unnamed protein product [Schistosoma margrebowiei]|uniref:Uncharacterized protein n=1 Tax=Schistosoma margrebowiei TaxID=48269 RepID=A0A183MDY5_9TREM|nr:unnamed protein product [Schistosoma margrebowiei]